MSRLSALNFMQYNHNMEKRFLYTHQWAMEDKSDGIRIARIGITSFVQNNLGTIIKFNLPQKGDFIEKEEVFGTVEADKAEFDLCLPLSGEVMEINSDIIANPKLANTLPETKGWLLKIIPQDWTEWDQLMTMEEYKEHTQ